MENGQQQKTLLTELIEGLARDVAKLIKLITDQPKPPTPPDLQPFLEKVANAINGLRDQIKTLTEAKPQAQAPATESTEILEELRALRQAVRKSPANQITKAVQYGAALLVVSLLTTGILAYYATKWRIERDVFEISDWKWRAVRQTDAVYATKVDAVFTSDSTSQPNKEWIIQQEQADATRAAAQKAAERAKVMNAEADKLEGKKQVKGKKSR